MLRSRSVSLILLAFCGVASADPIAIPNFSFELPPVERNEENPFGALPFIDDWDETAIGLGDESDQNTGVFLNTDVGEPDHITNAHLDRLAFVSSLIGNTVRQTLAETYEVGKRYTFTIAIGKSTAFPAGGTEQLEVALYYLNGGIDDIIISRFVSGSQVGTTTLLDVSVTLPYVNSSDPWVGEPIGVLVRPALSDPDDEDGEGFWNVDHARLEELVGIPAASTWGLLVLSIMILTMGTLALGRREAIAA